MRLRPKLASTLLHGRQVPRALARLAQPAGCRVLARLRILAKALRTDLPDRLHSSPRGPLVHPLGARREALRALRAGHTARPTLPARTIRDGSCQRTRGAEVRTGFAARESRSVLTPSSRERGSRAGAAGSTRPHVHH